MFGGFVGVIAVYGIYKQQFDLIATEFTLGKLNVSRLLRMAPASDPALRIRFWTCTDMAYI